MTRQRVTRKTASRLALHSKTFQMTGPVQHVESAKNISKFGRTSRSQSLIVIKKGFTDIVNP